MTDTTPCFHCGLPVPETIHLTTKIDKIDHPMCCHGCQAVAQSIVDAGLDDFYRYRDKPSATAKDIIPDALRQLTVYDHEKVRERFVQKESQHINNASLILEGITCAACVWLNEKHLINMPGILAVNINYTTHRAQIKWDESQIKLSEILQAIEMIGYHAHPYDPESQQRLFEKTRKQQLLRIAVAGVLGMQVMMISIALYAGQHSGMDAQFRYFFRWINFALCLPVLLYSAQTFFKTAWIDLKQRRVSMDVPVSLGISIAFIGSVWATVTNQGEVYYDSVVMFVFFLLVGRYLELMARKRGNETLEALSHSTPAITTRLTTTGEETIPVVELNKGDKVLVRPGELIPADGIIVEGVSSVNEALLTGESLPIPKGQSDLVIAGSTNIESPLQITVQQIGENTLLSGILRLLERAQTEKPKIMQLTDKIAGYFVSFVLLLTVMVSAYWYYAGADNWLPIVLSMLVVTCPCALSLATPAAISAATSALSANGMIATRGHVLETLAQASHIIFDKTGTLTQGQLQLTAVKCYSGLSQTDCLSIAKALEQHSEHPIAQVFQQQPVESVLAKQVKNTSGAGLTGQIGQQTYYLGTAAFIQQYVSIPTLASTTDTLVFLATEQQLLAHFSLADRLREDTVEVIHYLQQSGLRIHLWSGDNEASVVHVASRLGISHFAANLKPADKLEKLQQLQQQGAVTVMIGDGINDAPVLAAATASIAMNSGSDLAKIHADMLLLGTQLKPLQQAHQIAQRCLSIIRQNLAWAIGYNLMALPAAALGFVPPWLAAIGMSTSSLVVVLNALRLTR